MAEFCLLQKVRSVSPAGKVASAVTVLTVVIIVALPVAELQEFFWGVTVVGFLIGDSITTGYLGKFGLEEQERGYTRWVCGAEPTLVCATVTRLFAFIIIFTLYVLVIRYRLLWEYTIVQLTVLLIPVIFGLMGVGATLINTYGIWMATKK